MPDITKFSPIKSRSGRPPKFSEPRRPVTVTLPESTLDRLASIDADRARAIVKVTDAAMPLDTKEQRVQLVEVGPGLGVIIVGPSQILRRIEWLRLVEVAPTRFLLTIAAGTSVEALEVAITDLLEAVDADDAWEQSLLSELRDLIRNLRRRGGLSKAEMLFIDTHALAISKEGV